MPAFEFRSQTQFIAVRTWYDGRLSILTGRAPRVRERMFKLMKRNHKGMNRRFLSVLLTAAVMAGVVSGCGSAAGNTTTNGSSASAVSGATAATDSTSVASVQTASASETAAGAQSGATTADNSAIDATANRPVSEGEEMDASKLSNVPSSSQEGASTAASSGRRNPGLILQMGRQRRISRMHPEIRRR